MELSPEELLRSVREELHGLNQRIVSNRFLSEAAKGKLAIDKIRLFVENQYYIVYHDARSLALMVNSSKTKEEAEYFAKLLEGDLLAFRNLIELGDELGVAFRPFEELRIIPGSVAYTHYLAWLALYGNPGEQAFALIVNLPVWGEACAKLGEALRKNYGVRNTKFLDAFATLPSWVEEDGLAIVGNYLKGTGDNFRLIAKMIQHYEIGFWEGIYRGEKV